MRARLGHRVDRLARRIVGPAPEQVFDEESLRIIAKLAEEMLASDDAAEAEETRLLLERMHEEIGAPAAAEAHGRGG